MRKLKEMRIECHFISNDSMEYDLIESLFGSSFFYKTIHEIRIEKSSIGWNSF